MTNFAGSSAAGELWVDKDTATVERIGVLRDVGDLDVVLGLSQSLCDLWVDVVLGAALRRLVQVLALVRVSVLLALPHE